ncbi:hypothetical protein JTE90_021092 [Oedothorax gibbosus]|uniref:Secreted protein n=1 Tax=Oedothorax gibbosus TaxID=931172 RepID=A0AAV6VTG1_9ARAC|nr:hypothetical protein JTE90_021092 [Oedothorax gibbosus]
MLVLTAVLLFAGGVLSDTTDDEYCNQMTPAHCFADKDENPVVFPDSIEALNKMCPIIIRRLKCGIDYLDECGTKRIPRNAFESQLNDTLDFMVEACNTKTKLHEDLTESLPCIENVMKSHNDVCMPMVIEAVEEISKHIAVELTEQGHLVDESDTGKYYCFFEALQLSCFLAKTSVSCGEDTKNLVEGIFERFQLINNACKGNMDADIKAAIAIVQLEMEQRLSTDNSI